METRAILAPACCRQQVMIAASSSGKLARRPQTCPFGANDMPPLVWFGSACYANGKQTMAGRLAFSPEATSGRTIGSSDEQRRRRRKWRWAFEASSLGRLERQQQLEHNAPLCNRLGSLGDL